MNSRAFAVVTNRDYLPGVRALLRSIAAYHGDSYPVYIFVHGEITEEDRRQLRDNVHKGQLELIEMPLRQPPPPGCWEVKQQALAQLVGQAETVCLLDADLILLSDITDVFALAESGKIVSCRDGMSDRVFDAAYEAYSPSLPGRHFPYFNSGFFCLNIKRHWDLVGLWAFASEYAGYSPHGGHPLCLPGHGDQGHLNACAALLQKQSYLHLFEQEEWCNCLPASGRHTVEIKKQEGARLVLENRDTGRQQRLLHWS